MIDMSEDLVVLNTFYDALDAGRACRHLEENEIPFVLENLSVPQQGVSRFQEGPSLRLDVLIRQEDMQRAKTCLRETMHLFPEREFAERMEHEPLDDEDVLSQAIVCEKLLDAQTASNALKERGIWSTVQQVVDEEDGTTSYSVEVKGHDIEQAMLAIDMWTETEGF